MPININDLIENLAAAAPTIRGAQNQVTGWLYAEVGGTPANGWNISSAFRDTNSAVVSGTSIYIYTGADASDGEWQDANNWSEVSGSGGGIALTDLSVDTVNPASTTVSSLTYDDATGQFDFTPIDITGKQDTLTGTSDVPGLDTELASKQDTLTGTADVPGLNAALGLKADKQTITQSGGTITGTIDTSGGTFSLTAPTGGGGDALTTAGLDQFDSVTFTSLADVDIMMYDNATSDWINVPPAGHKAVWYGSGSTGEVITWDGTTWNPGQLAYGDLTGLPVLGTVATTNAYGDLNGLPTFGTVATTNNYSDLSQLPTFVQGTNVTIQTTTNANGGTQYTIASSGTGTGATSLAGLSDVLIPSPANGEVLTYNGSTSEWNSGPISFPVTGVNNVGIPTGNGQLTLVGGVIQYQGPDLSGYALTSSLGNSSGLDVGTTAGTVAAGDDSRLSDARTPTAHTHVIADLTDAGNVVGLDIGTTSGTVAAGDDARLSDARTPTAHTHVIADLTDAGNVVGLDIGTTAGTVCAGDDARLSDARTPTAHTHTHDDITDFDAEVNTLAAARVNASDIGNLNNVSSTAPSTGQVLKWDGSEWAPGVDNTSGGSSVTDLNDITIAGDATSFAAGINNSVMAYNNANSQWETTQISWPMIDSSASSVLGLGDSSTNPFLNPPSANQILAYTGVGWTNYKVPLEALSMTMAGDPADGDYYMVMRMPCAATVTDISVVATGSGATFDYTISKENGASGILGAGTATPLHASVTGSGTTLSNPTATTTAIAAGDIVYVSVSNASGCDQIAFNVEYEPTLRAL